MHRTNIKQLIILLFLIVLLPIGIRAQEDDDIAASLNLNEVVVLALSCMHSRTAFATPPDVAKRLPQIEDS